MHIVIFTGGVLRGGKFVKQASIGADLVIAADSGALSALKLGVVPKVVIGDFDGLTKKDRVTLQKKGCELIAHNPEKDQTDTELSINYAIDQGANKITVLGGIEGDRIDHILANILILTTSKVPIRYVNGSTRTWIEKGPKKIEITGRISDLLSVIPLSEEVAGVRVTGLKFPRYDEPFQMGSTLGISNVFIEKQVTVTFQSGTLLFVHTVH